MNTDHWIRHFEANTLQNLQLRFPEGPCTLPDSVRIPLAASLAVFQLGESGSGSCMRSRSGWWRGIIAMRCGRWEWSLGISGSGAPGLGNDSKPGWKSSKEAVGLSEGSWAGLPRSLAAEHEVNGPSHTEARPEEIQLQRLAEVEE